MAVVATKQYFDSRGRPRIPEDLLKHNCLALRLQTYGGIYSWEFAKGKKTSNIRPAGQFVSNMPAQIVDYCVSGLGIACMPESYFEHHLAEGRLERVLTDWCAPFDGYYIYYPSRRQPTQAFSLILNALRAAYKESGKDRDRIG